MIGMGSWRLADRVSQPIDALVAHVEGMWRHQLPMDLRLYPLAEVRASLPGVCLPFICCHRSCISVRLSPLKETGTA